MCFSVKNDGSNVIYQTNNSPIIGVEKNKTDAKVYSLGRKIIEGIGLVLANFFTLGLINIFEVVRNEYTPVFCGNTHLKGEKDKGNSSPTQTVSSNQTSSSKEAEPECRNNGNMQIPSCPAEYQEAFKIAEPKVKHLLQSDKYTPEEKSKLFSVVNNVYKEGSRKITQPNEWVDNGTSGGYWRKIAAEHSDKVNLTYTIESQVTLDLLKLENVIEILGLPKKLPQIKQPYLIPFFLRINDSHRTCFILDLKNRRLEFYDSLQTYGGDSPAKALEELNRKISDHFEETFEFVNKTKNYKLQKDFYQCGIWVCKFLEERVHDDNFDPSKIENDFNIKEFREQVFASVVEYEFFYNVIGPMRCDSILDTLPENLKTKIKKEILLTCRRSELIYPLGKEGKIPGNYRKYFPTFTTLNFT